jgi:GNAT superfamily N-acetyltransferase
VDVWARRATAADAVALAVLDAAARSGVAAQRGGPLFLQRDSHPFEGVALTDPDALVVVGGLDDVVLGAAVAMVERLDDGTRLGILHGLYVEPDAREVGIGEAMMELVLDWCREQRLAGIDGLALPGDRATKNFFERFGLTARAIVVHRAL